MIINETPKYRYTLPLDLQLFAGGEGGEGGESGGNEPKTYTEEELKAQIKEARKTAAAEAVKKRFGELADMDLEELKAAVELKKKIDEEKQSKGKDDDKIDPALEAKLEEKLKEKEKEQSEKMFKRMLTADVKVIATELEFADWEDALALADLSEVEEDDNGNLIGVKEALEELAKNKPHLIKQKQSGRFGADVKPSQHQKNERLEQLKKLAQNRGQTVQIPNDPWKRN